MLRSNGDMDANLLNELKDLTDPEDRFAKLVQLLGESQKKVTELSGTVNQLASGSRVNRPGTSAQSIGDTPSVVTGALPANGAASARDDDRLLFTRGYAQRVNTPTLGVGMSFNKYRFAVECWQQTLHPSIGEKEQACLLVNNLPDTDNYGGLKEIIVRKLT